MATRRSRLQVKPNILGGPKGPGLKSKPATPGKDSDKESTAGVEVNDNKDTEKNISISAKEKGSCKNIDEKAGKDETQTEVACEDVKEDKTLVGTPDITKNDIPILPARARLRKFGKVNISAAIRTKSEPQTEKAAKKQTENTATEKLEGDSDKTTHEEREENASAEKKITEDASKTNAAVQRRSRFPKAKPNIADAGRRRQREPLNKEEASSKCSETPKKLPYVFVSETGTPDRKPNQVKPETSESLPSTPTTTQFQPKPPATPTSILKSPLKHPTPTIPVPPEKRARTFSTSEPPVVKRQKKPKVTAPTDQPPDRTTMKMKDLIRWNPSNNPMKPKVKAGTSSIVKASEKENIEGAGEDVTSEKVVTPQAETEPEPEDTSMPVPQVTIGPDGNIVINEKSLVVKGPEVEKEVRKDSEIIDETDMFTTYASFRTRNLSKRWSKKDTKKFYKALAMIGIDFFLINQLFPNRSRLEIKNKFKKEEKVNKTLVDKVLKERINFDPTVFDANEESSDEEEPKGKKETKKKEKKNTPKEQNNSKAPANKSKSKRKRVQKNYYEDDTTSEEEECQSSWKPTNSVSSPSVSQKDGEVVDILMDMSKGRISGEDRDSGILDTSGKLTAVPARKVRRNGAFIPLESKTTNSQSQHDPNTSFENVPINIPGMQSIGIMQTQRVEPGPSVKIPVLNSRAPTDYPDLESSNRRIYLPNLNRNNSTIQSNIQPISDVFNPVQYNQNDYTQPPVLGTSSSQLHQNIGQVHLQPETSLTQLQQASSLLQPRSIHNQLHHGTSPGQLDFGTSHNQLQPGSSQNYMQQLTNLSQLEKVANQNQLQHLQMNSIPVNSSQVNSEDADQYVLVTVMPEGGGETVIHVYRLHGSGQSQNQMLYEPYSTRQMTVDSVNSVVKQQAHGDAALASNDSRLIDTSLSNTVVSDSTTGIVSQVSNTVMENVNETSVSSEFMSHPHMHYQEVVNTTQSDPQLNAGNEKFVTLQSNPEDTTLNESNIQIIITNENENDIKHDTTREVTVSDNDSTKLNSVNSR